VVDGVRNNGNAISCVIFFIDIFAYENEASVEIRTHHEDSCGLHAYMAEEENRIKYRENMKCVNPFIEGNLDHLYACTCNVVIEAMFERDDGEQLFMPFIMSKIKEAHPWLDDEDITNSRLRAAKELGVDSPLVRKLKPFFMEQMAHGLYQLEVHKKLPGGSDNSRPH
jgi:hypothetical protein